MFNILLGLFFGPLSPVDQFTGEILSLHAKIYHLWQYMHGNIFKYSARKFKILRNAFRVRNVRKKGINC